jgi:hypothetical protein
VGVRNTKASAKCEPAAGAWRSGQS